jgi:nicotinamidase/pyrazinamidase
MEKIVIGPQDVLALVDMQNDFAKKGGRLYVPGVPGEVSMEKLIENILKLLLLAFGLVAPTRDRHTANHIEQTIYGEHCLENTEGSEIIAELMAAILNHPKFRYFLDKGQDPRLIGYSLVYALKFAQFIEELRLGGFKRIFFSGVAFTHCVGESAIDMIRQLFEVYIIRDATLSIPKPYGDVEAMYKKLEAYNVKIINMEDIDFSSIITQ